ncbi:MAG: hypothetical protein KF842_12760 [Caulobacter sp.]|nr:hypothetical protein [Caulobacter sp.]
MKQSGLLIGVVIAFGAAGLAPPALAQAVPAGDDPIGDVLSGIAARQGMDDDAAESGDNPEDAAQVTAPTTLVPPGAPPPAYRPPPVVRRPQLDRPVMIDELSRTPEPPPTPTERAYDSRIKGGFAAAQQRQGPLDGEWVVHGPDGRPLYSLILVDKGVEDRPLEGAWRSLRPGQGTGRVGLVDSIDRTTTGVSVRFTPRGAREPLVITLVPAGAGWAGELWESGSTRRVSMRRD